MSQCIVPNWNLRKEQDEGEAGKRSSHVHSQHQNLPAPMFVGSRSNYEVAELIWENGHVAMHGLGGLPGMPSTEPTFDAGDTLESLVHQATYHKCIPDPYNYDCKPENMNSVVASSGGKWHGDSLGSSIGKTGDKPETSQQNQCGSSIVDGHVNSAFQETDANTLTWTGSLMQSMSADEDSACRSELKNLDEERDNKTETGRSFSTRRSRAATVHNQSERRRRDRINEKMKTLQKLVPNARKTDKASVLDEVIDYLKQLQAQLKMMSMSNMPQMMMPLGMQQQLQMSLLARMGMGMGMLDMAPANRATPQTIPSILHPTATAPAATPPFVPPPFLIPSLMSAHSTASANPHPVTSQPIPLPDPYAAFLTQSMNVDLYNKMAALYQQQINQTTQVGAPLHGSNAPHG